MYDAVCSVWLSACFCAGQDTRRISSSDVRESNSSLRMPVLVLVLQRTHPPHVSCLCFRTGHPRYQGGGRPQSHKRVGLAWWWERRGPRGSGRLRHGRSERFYGHASSYPVQVKAFVARYSCTVHQPSLPLTPLLRVLRQSRRTMAEYLAFLVGLFRLTRSVLCWNLLVALNQSCVVVSHSDWVVPLKCHSRFRYQLASRLDRQGGGPGSAGRQEDGPATHVRGTRTRARPYGGR